MTARHSVYGFFFSQILSSCLAKVQMALGFSLPPTWKNKEEKILLAKGLKKGEKARTAEDIVVRREKRWKWS